MPSPILILCEEDYKDKEMEVIMKKLRNRLQTVKSKLPFLEDCTAQTGEVCTKRRQKHKQIASSSGVYTIQSLNSQARECVTGQNGNSGPTFNGASPALNGNINSNIDEGIESSKAESRRLKRRRYRLKKKQKKQQGEVSVEGKETADVNEMKVECPINNPQNHEIVLPKFDIQSVSSQCENESVDSGVSGCSVNSCEDSLPAKSYREDCTSQSNLQINISYNNVFSNHASFQTNSDFTIKPYQMNMTQQSQLHVNQSSQDINKEHIMSSSICQQPNVAAGKPCRKRKITTDDNGVRRQPFSTESKKQKLDNSMYVALDCEFVGVGPRKLSALGRCSIVDYNGQVLCDVYAHPGVPITDYRTRYSGIRKRHMNHAVPLENAKNTIGRIMQGKVVVGHALHNDFDVLGLHHPPAMVRDTARYKPLKQMAAIIAAGPVGLKKLSAILLGRHIQTGQHCSVEDSRAAMDLFRLVQTRWEQELGQDSLEYNISTTDWSNSYLSDAYWPTHIDNEAHH